MANLPPRSLAGMGRRWTTPRRLALHRCRVMMQSPSLRFLCVGRVRPNRRANRRDRQKDIADVSRVLAREAALATELEMRSLPLDLFPLLEEVFEMSDGDLDSNWLEDYFVPGSYADGTGHEAGARMQGHTTYEAGADYPAEAVAHGPLLLEAAELTLDQKHCTTPGSPVAGTACHNRKRKREEHDMYQRHYEEEARDSEADCSDSAILAISVEAYYGPMGNALADMRRNLGRDPPDGIEELALLTQRLDEAKSRLAAALVLRPIFGPIAAGDVRDLLDAQLMDRCNSNEYAVGPGPFEWCSVLKSTVAEWDALDSERREEALDDAAGWLEEYSGSLDYVIEAFEEFVELEVQHRNDAYRRALAARLQASLNSR
jgi:hypothetical protein